MHPIKVGPRDLILLAGLPGAGKSTLLAGLRDAPELTVRDSDQLRALFDSRLPSWVPYRAYRPLVHAGHQLRVLTAALRAPGPVLVHDPATRAVTRTALAALARLSGRPAVFVWLDVPPPQALDGQRARGRILPPRSFARHVARADLLRGALFSGVVPPGWRCVVLLDRASTRTGLQVAVQVREIVDAAEADTTR
ncbi:MAG: AAA family ATPase [Pseudonocardiaceae bacterium]